ncbi:unnamed protein product [Psylliodes chrysocephalus]|uniref:HAT C-terminal dimerisation domain-containing protein n=1 Tax=Psylliodes chrysocephalus TaxID=3402493 RepID=A0A9P0CXX2_9CUCU|nr:unnamed protein product [Psylliodes chrysocephala]
MALNSGSKPFPQFMLASAFQSTPPMTWWKALTLDLDDKKDFVFDWTNLQPTFLEMCSKLLTAVASSAGLERIFSTFGLVQSKLRNRLGTDKAAKLTFIFKFLNQDCSKKATNLDWLYNQQQNLEVPDKRQGVKKPREDILREKRERERERRRKIREDPVKRQEQKEKERQKYLKQKQNNLKKSVKDMTPREQRRIRKKWKENSKNYRLKKKQTEIETSLLELNTPPISSDEENQPANVDVSFQRQIGRKIANRNKIKRYRERKEAAIKMQDLKRKAELYKKKYYRLLQKNKQQRSHETTDSNLTPLTKVNMLLNASQIEPSKVEEVKKSLIFGEVVQQQLVNTYQELKSDQKKQVFKKMLDGKVIEKYKMRTKLSTVMKFRKSSNFNNKNIMSFERKKGKHIQRTDIIKLKIKDFLELEDNSRVCPGKKEFVKKDKVTKQKRFLSNTLKNLYQKFLHAYPNFKISYKFFCLARPFYIKPMRVSDRETCKCIIHANMELIVQSLYINKIVFGKTPNDVIKDICCSTYAADCLLRKCNNCENAKPHFKEYIESELLQYFQWIYLKQNYFDKKTQTVKQTRKVAKQPKEVKAAELVTIFMKKLPVFLSHEGRILHQHHSISVLKKVLKANEIIIHCDFSENYSLKYAEEIQSFHFGSARQQITLHTVVVYSNDGLDTVTKSYCTLSESLHHGPAAIWAHLQPILKEYTQNRIDTIHFLSDSPATQYRNKQMFSFLTNHFMEHFPEVKNVSWNYHETGHGKGAPDGIGGVCKRTADRVVAQGKDISSFESLVNVLKECCPGISFYIINSKDIDTFASIISKQNLLAFKGTLKVHQVIPVQKKLWLRSLSCFTCTDFCKHYNLGSISYEDVSPSSKTHECSDEDLPLSTLLKNDSKLKFSDVYSDDEVPTCSYFSSGAKTGKYVLVSLKSVNKKLAINYRYVAVCQSDFQDDEIKVAFLRLSDCVNGDTFKIGEENDVSYVQEEQILEILPEPKLIIKGHRIYYKFPRSIDVFESA